MKKQRLDEAIEDYLAWRTYQGLSKNTLNNDRVVLTHMLATIGRNVYCDNVTEMHISQVFADASRTRSMRSLTLNHTGLNGFFTWCARYKRIPRYANPMHGRRMPKWHQEERRRVPVGKFPALLNAATYPRDRMLVALGLYLLGRAGELTGIKIGDVDLDNREILVRVSKSKRDYRMAITKELAKELRTYLRWYTEQCGPLEPFWYLVPARTRPRIIAQVIDHSTVELVPTKRLHEPSAVVVKLLTAIGFETRNPDGTSRHEGVHTLRRSGARARFDSLRARGYDGALREVQRLLHHKNASMTEHYIGTDLDDVRVNENLKDEYMYPSLADDNVVQLPRVADAGGN